MADVTIKVRADGPYKVMGPVIVRGPGGTIVLDQDIDDVCVLCRCGRSSNAPTCDGSHRHAP